MIPIAINMPQYLRAHPGLKYIFFGGKGGVGKTVMAGATALRLARAGKKTLLVSTNPVHSLSNLLGQNVFGRPTPVSGAERCAAYEIDTRETIAKSKREIRDKMNWFLKFADLNIKADEFVESATMNPAFEESAMFQNMIELMFRDEYEGYVFDTAPTANARRLLGMSQVYALWVEKMMQSRQEAQSLKELLSYSRKKEERDPIMDYFLEFKARMAHAKKLLTDQDLTAFFFVTLPESLPIAVITRFIGWFRDFGIPVGGVIVNGVIQREQVTADAAEFVRNRVGMQTEHLREIEKIFGDQVRARVPLFETEVQGVAMLTRLGDKLFAENAGEGKDQA
jgi:arsenite-transporting ATPase